MNLSIKLMILFAATVAASGLTAMERTPNFMGDSSAALRYVRKHNPSMSQEQAARIATFWALYGRAPKANDLGPVPTTSAGRSLPQRYVLTTIDEPFARTVESRAQAASSSASTNKSDLDRRISDLDRIIRELPEVRQAREGARVATGAASEKSDIARVIREGDESYEQGKKKRVKSAGR